jgi:hypothetical protein
MAVAAPRGPGAHRWTVRIPSRTRHSSRPPAARASPCDHADAYDVGALVGHPQRPRAARIRSPPHAEQGPTVPVRLSQWTRSIPPPGPSSPGALHRHSVGALTSRAALPPHGLRFRNRLIGGACVPDVITVQMEDDPGSGAAGRRALPTDLDLVRRERLADAHAGARSRAERECP